MASSAPGRPPIVWDPIPFGPRRKAEMVAYVRRHYGSFVEPTWRLIDPHVVVVHYTDSPDFISTYNTFASDVRDPELHELPGTCAHFVIDRSGTIHQLVPLRVMCRHVVGLNWTAIGIEHVRLQRCAGAGRPQAVVGEPAAGAVAAMPFSHRDPERDRAQREPVESLSPEDVPALRTQTHGDFDHHDMADLSPAAVPGGRMRLTGCRHSEVLGLVSVEDGVGVAGDGRAAERPGWQLDDECRGAGQL